jgi:hypothetical protein
MQQRNGRPKWRYGGLALLCVVLLVIPFSGPLGWVLFRMLLVTGALVGVYCWASRRGVTELLRPRDELSDEEAACKARLSQLKAHAEQCESTLRELRSAFRRNAERNRVEGARGELEATLREVQQAMARERAVLYSIEASRWQRKAEPLLREMDWLNTDFETADANLLEEWVQARLDRVNKLRPGAMGLQARVRTDTEAAAMPAGETLLRLVRRELTELEHLRSDLLTLRSELVAYNRPDEANGPDPEYTVQKLKELLQRIRARRETRLRPQREESTAALLRQSRSARKATADEAPLYVGNATLPSDQTA